MYRREITHDSSLVSFSVLFEGENADQITLGADYFSSVLHLFDGLLFPWTKLETGQCPCCPLTAEDSYHCPAALSISSILSEFGSHKSTEKVVVSATDRAGRCIRWGADLQSALHPLARFALFSSGCPVTERLRLVVDDLPPLATKDEMLTHVMLRLRILQMREGERAHATLDQALADLHVVASALCQRIRSGLKGDAVVNAVIMLDVVASLLEFNLQSFERTLGQKIENMSQMLCDGAADSDA